METTPEHIARMAKLNFATVYPLYLAKVVKKGRSMQELNQVITWLTGFSTVEIQTFVEENSSFALFFQKAELNKKADLITGVICGYRIENIEDPLTKRIRWLDKLVDDLARGKTMEKILKTH